MGTKNQPAPFDCYANAEADEPMFVLLARDVAAPAAIVQWAKERVSAGKNSWADSQIAEALDCAEAMHAWREERRP